jgi:predicted permease
MDATHGVHFELARHFLARFFESDLVTTPGQWAKVVTGVVSILLSTSILMLPLMVHRYRCLEAGAPSFFCPAVDNYPAMYLHLVRADTLWLIGLAMCMTALLTAIQWQSLFPTLRDCLALAAFPVSALEIFWSKLAAVVLAFAAFVLAMNAIPAIVFAWISASRWQAHPSVAAHAFALFASASAGCVFVFFGMLALQGLLLNLLPPRLFERVSIFAQAILFTANVAALPFLWHQPSAAWWPPNWFLGFSRYAVYATAGAPLLAILTYLLSYHRYRRLLIEIPQRSRAPRSGALLRWPAVFTLALTLKDAREQAVFSFLWKTLTRSRVHRLLLQVCAGLAIAWMIGAGDLRDRAPVLLIPLAVSVFLIAGLHYLFSVPCELRANWVFQTAESEGRASWLRGVDRFVVCCGLVPVYACSVPAAIVVFGVWQALRVTILGFFLALVVYEFLFRDWLKVPFTCSYLPGKRQPVQLILMAFGALSYLGAAALAIHAFAAGWATFAAAFPLLFGAWRSMRQRRTASWPEAAIVYDDVPEPAVATLQIEFERGSIENIENIEDFQPAVEAPAKPTPFWSSLAEEEPDPAPFFRLAGLAEDFRFGLRLIRKNWRLSVTIVATLALGIGMNVSVFTLLNAVAFRPRVPDPDSFVRVSPLHTGDGMSQFGAVTDDEYRAYRDGARSLRSVAASYRASVTLGTDRSSTVPAMLVSCNFFDVFGTQHPKSGRFFRPDECTAVGQAPVAVVAEEVWRDRYGSDPQILGRTISINDRRFTVVGVAPAQSAARINGAAVWVPYTMQPTMDLGFDSFHQDTSHQDTSQQDTSQQDTPWLWLDGRLAPGASRDSAQAELAVLARQLDRENPGRKTTLLVTDGSFLAMQSIVSWKGGSTAAGFWMMMFLMLGLGMVLLITCANVMTLLLSRAVARRREIAVRLSLGAPRARLLRLLLTEGFILAAAAGAISLYASFHIPAILFEFVERQSADFPLAPDWRIFAYIFGVAFVAGSLCALAPAMESLRVDLTASLKGYSSTADDANSARLRTVLVTSQVALSLALLVAAGMFLQVYWRLFHANPGYDTRHVLVAPLRFPAGSTRGASSRLAQDALARLAALPGVSSVARSNAVPFAPGGATSARFADRGIDTARTLNFQSGAPDLLRTLGIKLMRGRDFREPDVPSDVPASGASARAIVSERMAREMSPGSDPVGRVLQSLHGPRYEIIGVAKDVNTATDNPIVYTFEGWDRRQTFLMAHFQGDAHAAEDAMRSAVRNLRPDLLVMPRTLQSYVDDAIENTWRVVILILMLGLVTMTLSVAGIYGVVSFTVTEKTRELGIRVALGAQKADIFREVLVSGARPVVLGLFVGLWIALAADSAIRTIFQSSPFELDAANPAVYLGSAAALAAAALAAMFFPARRGARGDPMKALHYE